jgi:hypothetical protein
MGPVSRPKTWFEGPKCAQAGCDAKAKWAIRLPSPKGNDGYGIERAVCHEHMVQWTTDQMRET